MGAPNAGRTFFCTAKFPTPFTLRHIPHKLHTPQETTICPSPLSPHTARAFVVRLHPFPHPRTQPYVISIFHSPKNRSRMRIKPLFVPDLPRSFFGRIALILETDKGTAQAMPLSRHHKIKTLPAKGNGKKGAWRTAAHQKAGHRSAESRAVLCGEYSSTCRRVLEYLPQSTMRCS